MPRNQMLWTSYALATFLILIPPANGLSIPFGETNMTAIQGPCGGLRKLSVLPGIGFDSLRDLDMAQVMAVTYQDCKTTPDGKYLIPDNTFVIPLASSDVELASEIIDSWNNYTSVTSRSFGINAESSKFGIGGSFSRDYQTTKRRQVNDKSTTFRVQARYTLYALGTSPIGQLDYQLLETLNQAIFELEYNNTDKADYILETVVRDYGTHVITRMYAGAVLLQEDFVNRVFVEGFKGDKKLLKESTKASFGKYFNFKQDWSKVTDVSITQQYTSSVTYSHVSTIGGQLFQQSLPVDEWVETIPDNVAAIDRIGVPLHLAITPSAFPNVELEFLDRLQTHLLTAITQYYDYNERRGCMQIGSPNFDYSANAKGDCNDTVKSFSFGGVYQTCSGNCSDSLNVKNPMTGGFTCPSGYSATVLRTMVFNKPCFTHCTGHRPRRTCVQKCDELQYSYKTYWCSAHGIAKVAISFGGIHTPDVVNPVTNQKLCPQTYTDVVILKNLHVCMSRDTEIGLKYALKFGGFFSCQYNNPFSINTSNCPAGYSQNTAIVDHDCLIHYCVKAGSFAKIADSPIVLPPFRSHHDLFLETYVVPKPV